MKTPARNSPNFKNRFYSCFIVLVASEAVGPIEYNLMQRGLLPKNPTLYPEEPDATPDQRNGTVQDTHEMTVWLWPIKEHLAITTSQRVVAQMMSETFKHTGLVP